MRIIKCPNCQAELQVEDIEPGTRIECAACDHKFVLPEDKPEEEKPLLLKEEKRNVQADKTKKQNAEDSFVFGFSDVVKSFFHVSALLFGIIGTVLLMVLLSQGELVKTGCVFAMLLIIAWLWLTGYFVICWLIGIYRNVLDIKQSLAKTEKDKK